MEAKDIADVLIMILLTTCVSVSFMLFMKNLNKKEYFSCGANLTGVVCFLSLMVNYILNMIINN